MYKVIILAIFLFMAIGNIYATIQSLRLRADIAALHHEIDALAIVTARTQTYVIWENNKDVSSLIAAPK